MEFLEAPTFTRYVSGYYLTDDEYRELQNRLAAAPEHGAVKQEDFGSFVGQTQNAAKDEEACLRVIYYYLRRTTNLADYALRQGRSFRPYA
jgi:hypothetical protein